MVRFGQIWTDRVRFRSIWTDFGQKGTDEDRNGCVRSGVWTGHGARLADHFVHLFSWYLVLARGGWSRSVGAVAQCVWRVSGGVIEVPRPAKMTEAMPGSSIGRAGGC